MNSNIKTVLKVLLLVGLLNVVRYLFGFHLEGLVIPGMFGVMEKFPESFNGAVKPFYLSSMFDALILFPLIALANGFIYLKLFPQS